MAQQTVGDHILERFRAWDVERHTGFCAVTRGT